MGYADVEPFPWMGEGFTEGGEGREARERLGEEHIMPDKTILIVDDTPANIAAALAILKDQYRTRVATSGAKALEHAGAADKPDLILLDVTMPDMDGYEVCGRLKADPETASIPVVFLTARTEAEDEAKRV